MTLKEIQNKLKSINSSLDQRDLILEEYYDTDEENDELMSNADNIEQNILKDIKINFDYYPVDFIIETLTRFGDAPCVIYDDNGRFAINSCGMENIPLNDNDPMYITHVIDDPIAWKTTIRDALKYYLE